MCVHLLATRAPSAFLPSTVYRLDHPPSIHSSRRLCPPYCLSSSSIHPPGSCALACCKLSSSPTAYSLTSPSARSHRCPLPPLHTVFCSLLLPALVAARSRHYPPSSPTSARSRSRSSSVRYNLSRCPEDALTCARPAVLKLDLVGQFAELTQVSTRYPLSFACSPWSPLVHCSSSTCRRLARLCPLSKHNSLLRCLPSCCAPPLLASIICLLSSLPRLLN